MTENEPHIAVTVTKQTFQGMNIPWEIQKYSENTDSGLQTGYAFLGGFIQPGQLWSRSNMTWHMRDGVGLYRPPQPPPPPPPSSPLNNHTTSNSRKLVNFKGRFYF